MTMSQFMLFASGNWGHLKHSLWIETLFAWKAVGLGEKSNARCV